jgi:hypothetical protein
MVTKKQQPTYSLIARKDLRDIFDQLSVTRKNKITLDSDKSRSAPELFQEKSERRKIGEFECHVCTQHDTN